MFKYLPPSLDNRHPLPPDQTNNFQFGNKNIWNNRGYLYNLHDRILIRRIGYNQRSDDVSTILV